MKKRILLAACFLLTLSACVKEELVEKPKQDEPIVFTATTESASTKTELSGNDAEGYAVLWKQEDGVAIQDGEGHRGWYEAAQSGPQTTLNFRGTGTEVGDGPYTAWYPISLNSNLSSGSTMTLYDVQRYTAGNIDQSPMYASSESSNLNFKNLCGIIRLDISTTLPGQAVHKIILSADQNLSGRFTISGDAAVITDAGSGTGGITLNVNNNSGVAIGNDPTPFYISVPQGDYTNLSIKVITTNFSEQTRTANKTITVKRSKITPITLSFNALANNAEDLGAVETANCYVVHKQGSYKFPVNVAGNGAADLGGISRTISGAASAELLWATEGNRYAPTDIVLIRNVRYENGYVYFETGLNSYEGNALIAVKNAGGTILWSWHIWFESDDLLANSQIYPGSNAVMMDRNLGATTTSYSSSNFKDAGLLYEWGRKDPFPNTVSQDPNSGTVGLKGTQTTFELASLDIAAATANPTKVSSGDISGATWAGSAKNIFDPCPPGWKVPDRSEFSGITDQGTWQSGKGGTFPVKNATGNGNVSAWFPASGLFGHGHIQYFEQGSACYLYTTYDEYARSFDFSSSNAGSMQNKDKYWACSVRCVRDVDYVNPEEYTDLSSAGTANCYVVPAKGQYKFIATVKGNGAAALAGISPSTSSSSIASAELVWASYGSTTAPENREMIYGVTYKDGYVYFSTGSQYKRGNAVVAIKDGSGNILWSWHLWFTDSALGSLSFEGGDVFMNRNLGATTSSANSTNSQDSGLLYQWGRKDPFLNAPDRTTYSSTEAAILGTARVAKNELYTVAQTVLQPTYYPFTYNNTPWMTEELRALALWNNASKTIFDPCPAGWKVPAKSSWGSFFMDYFNNPQDIRDGGLYVRYTGGLITWIPDTGYRQGAKTMINSVEYIQGQGIIQHRGEGISVRIWCSDGILWKDTFNNNTYSGLYDYDYDLLGSPCFYYGTYRDHACSVRCVKE